jgi:hypothetical protein
MLGRTLARSGLCAHVVWTNLELAPENKEETMAGMIKDNLNRMAPNRMLLTPSDLS